jgi:hypothetical protein
MALTKNNYGGTDLLATVTELDKRVTALEDKGKIDSSAPPVSKTAWTPTPPKK